MHVDLKKMWRRLMSNSKTDAPEPHAFASILRFLASSEKKLEVDMPAWMPVLPENLASLNRTRRSGEVTDFLQWSFGSNPLSVENFCEVAAAYHASKACSYYKPGRYAEMVEEFINAVEAERGEGFLMAVLMAYGSDKAKLEARLKPTPMPGSTYQFSEIKGVY